MENASKALLMAGGVLITIIIVSVFVFMYNSAKALPKTQEQVKEAEEIAKFNKPYESYAKNNIRGTDVYSVIYMANDNNAKYSGDTQFHITIEINIKNAIDATVRKFELKNNKWVQTGKNYGATTNYAGWYYNIETNNRNATQVIPSDIAQGFQTDVENNQGTGVLYSINGNDWSDTLVEEEAVRNKCYYTKNKINSELKRRKFNCTDVGYSSDTGRVNYMSFEEYI